MSFNDMIRKEKGPSSFAIFEFMVSEGVYYRYTDTEEPVWFQGNEFTPAQLTYSNISQDGTLNKTDLKIEAPRNLAPAKSFRYRAPSTVVRMTIWESNFADPDREFQKIWAGRILNCKIEKEKSVFQCQPVATSLSRPGLTRHFQRPCPLSVYGNLCRATRTEQDVLWVSGSTSVWTVSIPTSGFVSADSYAGGMVSWVGPDGEVRHQTILQCAEDGGNLTLVVNSFLSPSEVPSSIKLIKGCDHTETACIEWHDNILNFGGCSFIPEDTPLNKFSTFF